MEIETNKHGNRVTRTIAGGDRYRFDFRICSPEKGWEQFDTDQDASWFGIWVHLESRRIITFCEGDLIIVNCDSDETFKAEMAEMAEYYGSPPPAFKVISSDGVLTEIYVPRPMPE